MLQADEMTSAVQGALEQLAEVNLHDSTLRLALHDGRLVMTGEVQDIVAKRLAHLAATRLLGADRVLDELCVTPTLRRSDAEIARFLDDMLMQESAFREYSKEVIAGTPAHRPGNGAVSPGRTILASVSDAVVTLGGAVGSLTHRRLADVLAWWSPGVCSVRNYLRVIPEQQDNDAELCDALRIILEKDPWLDAAAIRVRVKDRVVTLQGGVPGQEQSRMALQDAWYILGVHGVDNQLQVLDT